MKRIVFLTALGVMFTLGAANPTSQTTAEPAAKVEPTPPAPAPAPITPSVTMPSAVTMKPGRYARVTIHYVGDDLKWWTDLNSLDVFREYDPTPQVMVLRVGGDPGTYSLHAVSAGVVGGKAVQSAVGSTSLTIGIPTPPAPPGPGPGPAPPAPPSPAPIAGDGLRTLIIYDSSKALSAAQQGIIFGSAMRAVLNAKCALEADGKTHAWRIWDQGVATDNESQSWKDAFKLPHPTLPFIIVSNPQVGGGFQGPLPASAEETVTLLKRFGG